MKVSMLIKILQDAQDKHGDLHVRTWEGDIHRAITDPCYFGMILPSKNAPTQKPNTIGLTILHR